MRFLLTAAMISALAPGPAGGGDPVVGWIDRTAVPVASTDPNAPLEDLRPLRQVAGGATVVGLGESTHGSREQFRIKHRMVRLLVERMGFRTLAFEDDFAGGLAVDHYVLTGQGDPRRLIADLATPYWSTEEILDLVRWMRSFNQTHRDKVRYLGTDTTQLRPRSFGEVTAYVRQVAPHRLAELETYLAPIRPALPRLEHLTRYIMLSPAEKQPLIDSARRARDLVLGLPDTGPRLPREFAEQHARTIVGWHESHANRSIVTERETFMADTVLWWQRVIGGKIAYWAANAHTAAAPAATVRLPGFQETGTWAGGHLRDRLGGRYVSICTVFGSGSVNSGIPPQGPAPHPVGPPSPDLLEATLGAVRSTDYLLDLRRPAPTAVRDWLAGPATTRMIHPRYVTGHDPNAYALTVPSLSGAFDAIVYLRTMTPSRFL